MLKGRPLGPLRPARLFQDGSSLMASRQTLGVRPDAAACRTRGRKADRLSPAQELRQALAVEHAEDKAGKFLLSADYAVEHGRELLARHGEYLRIELFLRGDRGLGED